MKRVSERFHVHASCGAEDNAHAHIRRVHQALKTGRHRGNDVMRGCEASLRIAVVTEEEVVAFMGEILAIKIGAYGTQGMLSDTIVHTQRDGPYDFR